MSSDTREEELTFEAAMERLEALVEQMESAQLPLTELVTRYEEGTRLLQICGKQLEAAEKRVQIITRNGPGKPKLVDFEKEKETPEPPPASAPARPQRQTRAVEEESGGEISLF